MTAVSRSRERAMILGPRYFPQFGSGRSPLSSFATRARLRFVPRHHPAMSRTLVKDALHATAPLDSILLQGWVRTRRDAKAFSFIEVNDGSCLKGIQVIADA